MATTQMMSLEIDPHPAIIVGGFYRAANAFRNFQDPIRKSIEEVIIPAIDNNFESEGIPPWEPLADATYLNREFPGKPILQQSGNLRSMATSIRPWTINDNEAFLLSSSMGDAYYGAFHEFGTKWMTARPWSTIDTRDEDAIEMVFLNNTLFKILKFATVTTLVGGLITAGIGGLGSAIRGLTGGR